MKNKTIFNLRQYYQAFKQMKLIGIICTVILAVISLIIPINRALSIKSDIANGLTLDTDLPRVVDYVHSNTFLIITFIIITPILTLYCWNFLTKRSSSDFYHSLPYTRTCSYISNILAIVTWIVILLGLSMTASIIGNSIFSKYLLFDISTVFRMYLAIFIINLLCMACVTLACTVTGTVFSNICVSGVIIFFVRFMIMICTAVISLCIPILSSDHTLLFFDNNHNLLTGICFSIFRGGSISDYMLSNTGNIYTAVLAIIYIAAAGLIYKVRKSETAGKVAINSIMQFIIRVIIGFSVCLVGVISVISAMRNDDIAMYRNVFVIIITFIIAGLVIIMYECISTKTIRGIISSIPSIAVTYITAIVFCFGLNAVIDSVINFRPTTDEVKYVSIVMDEPNYNGTKDYFKDAVKDIKIENKEIIDILTKALEENIDVIVEDNNHFYNYVYDNKLTPYSIKFKTKGFSQYRQVYLSGEDINKIGKDVQNIDEYKNAYLSLPDADSIAVNWNVLGYNILDNKTSKEVYNMLLEEMKSINFSDWYMLLNNSSSTTSGNISFVENGVVYRANIPITDKLPKTKGMLFNKINETSAAIDGSIEAMCDVLSQLNNNNISKDEAVNFEFYDPKTDSCEYLDIYEYKNKLGENSGEIFNDIKNSIRSIADNKNYDFTKPYAIMTYNYYKEIDDYMSRKSIVFILQLDGYNNIKDYYGK